MEGGSLVVTESLGVSRLVAGASLFRNQRVVEVPIRGRLGWVSIGKEVEGMFPILRPRITPQQLYTWVALVKK